MTQFDVFSNPVEAARHSYPYVVILQADIAAAGGDKIVAPLVRRKLLDSASGRLTPFVKVGETDFVVVVPAMTSLRAADLRKKAGTIASSRTELLASIDYLFFGL